MRSSRPLSTSQSRAVPSTLPERARFPSGEKATAQRPLSCPFSRRISFRVATSQSRDRILLAAGESQAAVGRKCHRSDLALVAEQLAEFTSRVDVPESRGPVQAARQGNASVGREGKVRHLVLVAPQAVELASGPHLPDPDGAVLARRQGPAAVRRHADAFHPMGMPLERAHAARELAGLGERRLRRRGRGNRPDMDHPVGTSGHHVLPVGRGRDAPEARRRTEGRPPDRVSRLDVPEPHGPVAPCWPLGGLTETTRRPSAVNATPATIPSWPTSRPSSRPVSTSQTYASHVATPGRGPATVRRERHRFHGMRRAVKLPDLIALLDVPEPDGPVLAAREDPATVG